jgi:hypothetical protein
MVMRRNSHIVKRCRIVSVPLNFAVGVRWTPTLVAFSSWAREAKFAVRPVRVSNEK